MNNWTMKELSSSFVFYKESIVGGGNYVWQELVKYTLES